MTGGPPATIAILAEGEVGRLELAVRREGPLKRLYLAVRPSRPEMVESFVRRGRSAATVIHANVLRLLDLMRDAEGPYVWCERVEGVTVEDVVRDVRHGGDPVPVQVALRVALQVAEGAQAAEALAPVVAPRWILVGYDGIARLTGLVAGAADEGYAAPEILRGGRAGGRSELFALGVCLHEMLSGSRLYPSGEPGSTRRILEEPTPDVALEREEVPTAAVELLFELMAKDPARRPTSAAEVARRLHSLLRELAAEEEPIELGPWLSERFAARRNAERRQIADQVVELEMGGGV